MNSGKLFIFSIVMLLGGALLFPQLILGPAAKWHPSGIVLNPNVIIEGTSIEISATIQILKNVRGLKYEGGVDRQVHKKQEFPGQLQAGTTVPVKFNWTVVRGRHNVFFKLILPGTTPRRGIKIINKVINGIPRIQTPGQNTNVQRQPSHIQNPCQINQNVGAVLKIRNFSCQYTAVNNNLIYSYTVFNDSPRCIKEFKFRLAMVHPANALVKRDITNEIIGSEKPGGWALKGNERRSILGNFFPSELIRKVHPAGWTKACKNNSDHKCLHLYMRVIPHNAPGTGDSEEYIIDLGVIE